MTLGEKIKRLRKEKDWSQEKLGKKIGADAHRICNYEKGKVTPSAEALVKIAGSLGVTVDYLLTDDTDQIAKAKLTDKELLEQFKQVEKLSEEDKVTIKNVINSILLKNQLNGTMHLSANRQLNSMERKARSL